jgi:hypothetical protein
MPLLVSTLALTVTLGLATVGRADEESTPRPRAPVEESVAAGRFLSLTQPAALAGPRAYAVGTAGYDSARRASLFEAAAEVHVFGPVALRGGAVYTGGDQRLRPSFGARVQALRESRHGVDAAVGVFYRPEGLTEPEGEIETVVAVARHLGDNDLLANLAYGQDPEGHERDGEVRLALIRQAFARMALGFDGRLRFAIGAPGSGEPSLDALLGPTVMVPLGPIAIVLNGGGSALRLHGKSAAGAFLLGGLGTAF